MADATFGRIACAVPVSDISRALGFYAGILGMSVTFTNGDPVGFVIRDTRPMPPPDYPKRP